MKNVWQAFGLLSLFSSEVVVYLVGSYYLAQYLDVKTPLEFDWIMITTPLSLLLCLWAGFKFFGRLTKTDQEKAKQG